MEKRVTYEYHILQGAPAVNKKKQYTPEEAQFLKNIGFRIQFFRKKADMSQEELAEQSQLSYSTISHIEATASYPISLIASHKPAALLPVSAAGVFHLRNY